MLRKLHKLFLTLFCLLLMPLSIHAEMLEFAQIGDVHYVYGNHELDKYLYFLNLSLKKRNIDFAVFLGDNVDKSTEENVIGLMRCLYPWRIPYYLVLGNNDAHKLNGLEKQEYLDIVTTFNHNQKDRANFYYFKPNSNFICVVLDDTPDFAPSNHGELSDEQLVWLDNLLTKYSKKLFLIFQHSPLNPPREEYKLSLLNTDKYRDMLKKHSNVVLMSSGHYHQESIKQDDNGIWHISAPAFYEFPHSYQMITIKYDEKNIKSPKDIIVEVKRVKV